MEVALTFGAVGDFLSIALLIKDIIAALDECRGSAKAYRDLIEEITLLQKNVDQIERIFKGPELGDGFQDLDVIAQTTIAQIRKCLEDFSARVRKKYGESLAEGGSGNVFKDVTRKIQWKFEEKEVEKFRSDVVAYRMSLEMFLQVTTIRLVQNNHKSVSKQLQEVEANTISTVRQYGQSIENYLRFLGLCIIARLHFISKLGTDVKQTAGQILAMMFVMSGELSIIKAIIMQLDRGIDNGEHFVLEDATGRSFPIHLRTIISWEAFDVILKDRFKGKRGERRIRRKFYSLHESASQLEIDRSVNFVDAFVPNQKVDMSLICRTPDAASSDDGDASLSSCPWCRTTSSGQLGAHVKCANCKRHFTRVLIDADDVNKAPFVPSAPKSRATQFSRGESAAAGSLAPRNAQHDENETKEQRPGDKTQKGIQEFDPESESDEENISGLAHITLRTRRIRPPKEGLSPVLENGLNGSIAGSEPGPPPASQPPYARYGTPGPGQVRDHPARSYTPVSFDPRGPPPGPQYGQQDSIIRDGAAAVRQAHRDYLAVTLGGSEIAAGPGSEPVTPPPVVIEDEIWQAELDVDRHALREALLALRGLRRGLDLDLATRCLRAAEAEHDSFVKGVAGYMVGGSDQACVNMARFLAPRVVVVKKGSGCWVALCLWMMRRRPRGLLERLGADLTVESWNEWVGCLGRLFGEDHLGEKGGLGFTAERMRQITIWKTSRVGRMDSGSSRSTVSI